MNILSKIIFYWLLATETITGSAQIWQPFGSGFDNSVLTLLNDSVNNLLYAGGSFDTADGSDCSRISKWNNSYWDTIGTGLSNGNVNTMTIYNNMLYTGGSFTNAGNKIRKFLTRWNGVSWDSIAFTTSNCFVNAMLEYNGELYVGGGFPIAGGIQVNNIARFDGSQ